MQNPTCVNVVFTENALFDMVRDQHPDCRYPAMSWFHFSFKPDAGTLDIARVEVIDDSVDILTGNIFNQHVKGSYIFKTTIDFNNALENEHVVLKRLILDDDHPPTPLTEMINFYEGITQACSPFDELIKRTRKTGLSLEESLSLSLSMIDIREYHYAAVSDDIDKHAIVEEETDIIPSAQNGSVALQMVTEMSRMMSHHARYHEIDIVYHSDQFTEDDNPFCEFMNHLSWLSPDPDPETELYQLTGRLKKMVPERA